MFPSHRSQEIFHRPLRRQRYSRRLRLEPLEARRVLAVVTVDTDQDLIDFNDGVTSLREAIFATNIVAGADEIVFDFGHDGPATIFLQHGELEITDELTVTGDGPDLLTIDAQEQSRIFNVTAETGDFALVGMTLTGGETEGDGAVRSLSTGNLHIENTDMIGNVPSGQGVSISAVGNVTVTSGNISGNGGSAILGRDVTVTSSTISGNSGGGISCFDLQGCGDVIVTSSTISGNRGGGIFGRNVTVTASTVSGHYSIGSGGGIAATGDVTVISSTISGNFADEGGGAIHAFGDVIITSSTVSGSSTSEEYGGSGILGRNVTVTSSTISGNDQGGIGAGDTVTVVSSVIVGNFGNGISAPTTEVISSTISGNWGGGIGAETATVAYSTISDNWGGGVAAPNATITSSTVSGNRSHPGISGDYLRVAFSTIWGNSIGIEQNGLGPVIISNSIVAENTTGGVPADLLLGTDMLAVEYSIIGDNTGNGLWEAPVGSPDANGNLVGGPFWGAIDPLLDPLADNGGLTLTHSLQSGSPAIDGGDPLAIPGNGGVPDVDQRGAPYARVGGGRVDMGAHERQSLTVEIIEAASPTITAVDEVTIQFSRPVVGFDLEDLNLSLNGGTNLLTDTQSLSTSDNQIFVLEGLSGVTTGSGYYTLELVSPGSGIMDVTGGPLDTGDSVSWVMGRLELGLTVDTLVDEADGNIDDGDISLRDAIAASAPGETIDFAASLDGGAILLTLGQLSVTHSLSFDATTLPIGLVIDATGSDPTPDVDDGMGSRIFDIDDGHTLGDSPVTIRGLTLTGGDVGELGGAIRSRESLSIADSEILANASQGAGGGVHGFGNVMVAYSTIAGNSEGGLGLAGGGGINALGNVWVNSSTISENKGDGIRAATATVTSATISDNIGTGIAATTTTATSCTVSGNTGSGLAGQDVTVVSSTISGNSAHFGGGIYGGSYGSSYGGNVTVISSTISGNRALRGGPFLNYEGLGGGIYARGNVVITSSTISGNFADHGGGGIFGGGALGDVTVTFTTVTGNAGGGIASAVPLTIDNSIVADNLGADLSPVETDDVVVHYSLIGDGNGLTEAPIGAPDDNGNLIGGPVFGVIDPLLDPLADNGGPTWTHALMPGSPGIDAGDPEIEHERNQFDQRGNPYARVRGGRVDMGAHERQGLTVDILDVASPTVTPVNEVIIQFSDPVTGFDVGDLELSHNRGEYAPTGGVLSTTDNQTFVLSDLAGVTGSAGYFTLRLLPSSESGIVDANGDAMEAVDSVGWAMGRSELGLTVDTLVDESDSSIEDGDVSLRDAILAAAPGETIDFDTSLDGGTLLLTRGEVSITDSLQIDAISLSMGLTVDAAGNDPTPDLHDGLGSRVFNIDDHVTTDSSVTIRGLTLTGGDVSDDGGAIRSTETLTVRSSTISGNSADTGGAIRGNSVTLISSTISDNFGGGIYSGGVFVLGEVTLVSSTISGNSETHRGGGIQGAVITVNSSTISGNSARFSGGGISGDHITVSSSTISGNSARFSGGGISGNHITVSSSTISHNATDIRGGGIYVYENVEIRNSIVAGNNSGSAPDLWPGTGTLAVQYSLIGDGTGTGLREAPVGSPDANGNLIGGPVHSVIDPLLAPLADNGGPTFTHALLAGSPALNVGDPSFLPPPLLFDQRGAPFSRVFAGRVDMGAFELIVGDFNADGEYTLADIDPLVALIAAGTHLATYDLNSDGLVNLDDRDTWLAVAGVANLNTHDPYLLGDANLDGFVDGQDFIIWNGNKFTSTGLWSQADWNADGTTDGQDFIIWNGNKFQSSGVPVLSALHQPHHSAASARLVDTVFANSDQRDDRQDEHHKAITLDLVLEQFSINPHVL